MENAAAIFTWMARAHPNDGAAGSWDSNGKGNDQYGIMKN
jgi:hypothetical protein